MNYEEEIKRMKESKASREKERRLKDEYDKLYEEENPNYLKLVVGGIKNIFLSILEAFGIWKR